MTASHPDPTANFYDYGYQVIRELGHNRAGGRVTYLATEINSQHSVVLKQFQFAATTASWSDYQLYEQEIIVLRGLEHPNIPRYLDSFQTATGFCMVQEYKDAPSLAQKRQWKPHQIKQIALSVLEILHYLQTRIPPIVHRDLKPDNILVDDRMNVSLVDFGFARLGGGEVAASSVVKGTLGFMPPEQLFNRQLTVASDLYSLGATLICLLTHTPATDISRLIDDLGRIQFRQRLPRIHPDWLDWLEKMVEPNVQNRYATAETALNALIPLAIIAPPKPIQRWWVVAGGALVTILVLSIGLPLLLKFAESEISGQTAETSEPVAAEFAAQIEMTHQLNSVQNSLETLSLEQGMVYFRVKLSSVSEPEYQGKCQLFDGVGALVAMGDATLNAESDRLQAWCGYDFSKPADQPGQWTFKFFLDDRLVAQKQFNVVSINN